MRALHAHPLHIIVVVIIAALYLLARRPHDDRNPIETEKIGAPPSCCLCSRVNKFVTSLARLPYCIDQEASFV
jgi:hypothetical protein